MRFVAFSLALLLGTRLRAAEEVRPDFFAQKVRPILANHCFKCHGPDDKARKGKLRLDVRADALKPARSGRRAVVPGRPTESELLARVHSEDETEVMPPPSTKKPLSKEQKEILKRWILTGAEYQAHWAFVAPRQSAVPVMKSTWPRNPIDHFVLARLAKERLAPSAEADKYTLVRRLYLDLIGLPPLPEEAEAFVRDTRPDAYERLVDGLLASPAYGERWTRRWLDLARYADTNGYEKDRPRSIWPYRDWVLAAINADMPFDRFSIEQLAGDMLPGATLTQRVATGFHRNTMLNEEGGIDPLEFRFHAVADRLATTGTVWLGLTLGCAQCHAHKYDPISHQDYYRLFAFLNNADEPELELSDSASESRRREVDAEIARLEAGIVASFRTDEEKLFRTWLADQRAKSVRWTVLRPTKATGSLPLLTVQDDDSVFVTGDQSKSDTYDLTFRSELNGITALRLEALPDERLPRRGPGRVYYEGPAGDFFLSEISLMAAGRRIALKDATQSHAKGASTAQKAIDGDQQSGWSIDGGQGRAHQAVFRLEKPTSVRELNVRLLFERYYAAGLGRFRFSATTDSRLASARDLPLDLDPLLLAQPENLSDEDMARLRRAFLRFTPEMKKRRAAIDRLRQQLTRPVTTLVMAERPATNSRATFVHHRGEFLQPGARVGTGLPDALHGASAGDPRDRLGFARWLVSADNPLVGRVTVNRHWAAFFGAGLVRTVQDFGLTGELPSHPELLDWLAIEFAGVERALSPRRPGRPRSDRDWSVKALHRLILTSATYRQSSRLTPALLARDPDNRLLARGPRVRLEAEAVRDLVLRSSGLLTMRLGGPSVFPPQPPEVTTEGAYGKLEWRVSEGLDRHRRGLYTFMKRTAPFAWFGTFDGPSGEVCVARREVSNTPLQALTMLNDQTVLEASQALAKRLTRDNSNIEERVRALFAHILTRPPTFEEVKLLTDFYRAQHNRKDLNAAALAGPGDGDVYERAAWVALVRALFNLDETITKR